MVKDHYSRPTIQDDIKELREFQSKGIERIKFFYPQLDSNLDKDNRLRDPPHRILRKRAEKLLILSRQDDALSWNSEELMQEGESFMSLPIKDLSDSLPNKKDILSGVATEILLKAITLKEDPEWFRDQGFRPSNSDMRDKLSSILEEDLKEKKLRRIDDVLELIYERRNNAIHLGFHHMENYRQPHQFYKVWRYLLERFFDEPTQEVLQFVKTSEEKSEVKDDASDYAKVDL